jgi:hypothetical protein
MNPQNPDYKPLYNSTNGIYDFSKSGRIFDLLKHKIRLNQSFDVLRTEHVDKYEILLDMIDDYLGTAADEDQNLRSGQQIVG